MVQISILDPDRILNGDPDQGGKINADLDPQLWSLLIASDPPAR